MRSLQLAATVAFIAWIAGFAMGRSHPWPEQVAAQADLQGRYDYLQEQMSERYARVKTCQP